MTAVTSVQKTTPVPFEVIALGCISLAPFKDSQGIKNFYRARIEDVFPSPNGKLMAMVSVECPCTVICCQPKGLVYVKNTTVVQINFIRENRVRET